VRKNQKEKLQITGGKATTPTSALLKRKKKSPRLGKNPPLSPREDTLDSSVKQFGEKSKKETVGCAGKRKENGRRIKDRDQFSKGGKKRPLEMAA